MKCKLITHHYCDDFIEKLNDTIEFIEENYDEIIDIKYSVYYANDYGKSYFTALILFR